MNALISKGTQRLLLAATFYGGCTSFALAQKTERKLSYETWIASQGLKGAASKSTADPDNDGVSNALEFLLGGKPNPANKGSNSAALLRKSSLKNGHLTCSLKRKKAAKHAITLVFEWATDPKFTEPKSVIVGAASKTLSNAVITVTNDPLDPRSETVRLKVPLAGVSGGTLYGRWQGIKKVPAKAVEMDGYLQLEATNIPEPYDAGFSMYSAVWPLVDTYPGSDFQTGLFGTWMFPKQVEPVPPGEMYSCIEGGLGWWNDTQFPTLTPKFIMGGWPSTSRASPTVLPMAVRKMAGSRGWRRSALGCSSPSMG